MLFKKIFGALSCKFPNMALYSKIFSFPSRPTNGTLRKGVYDPSIPKYLVFYVTQKYSACFFEPCHRFFSLPPSLVLYPFPLISVGLLVSTPSTFLYVGVSRSSCFFFALCRRVVYENGSPVVRGVLNVAPSIFLRRPVCLGSEYLILLLFFWSSVNVEAKGFGSLVL